MMAASAGHGTPPLQANADPAKSLSMNAFSVRCDPPVLAAEFEAPQTMLSWSLTRPGFVTARSVAWLQVGDADLPLGVVPATVLETRLAAAGHAGAVQLMTSRDVRKHHAAEAASGNVHGKCLATVGLANAGRVGHILEKAATIGTINLLAHVDRPLTLAAMIEALSMATQARTAAIIDLGWRPDGEVVTGTGTDCIVVAAPVGADADHFAGLHTDVGAAIGLSVYDAVFEGGQAWISERGTARS